MARIKVVRCEPGKPATVELIESGLEGLQGAVGGDIEPVYGRVPGNGVLVLADEEGLLKGLPENRLGLVGTFIVLRQSGSEFVGLGDEQAAKIARSLG